MPCKATSRKRYTGRASILAQPTLLAWWQTTSGVCRLSAMFLRAAITLVLLVTLAQGATLGHRVPIGKGTVAKRQAKVKLASLPLPPMPQGISSVASAAPALVVVPVSTPPKPRVLIWSAFSQRDGEQTGIMTSTNLVDWTEAVWFLVLPGTNTYRWTDTNTSAPVKFYRAFNS